MQSADCVPYNLQTAYLAPCSLQTAQVLRLHATEISVQQQQQKKRSVKNINFEFIPLSDHQARFQYFEVLNRPPCRWQQASRVLSRGAVLPCTMTVEEVRVVTLPTVATHVYVPLSAIVDGEITSCAAVYCMPVSVKPTVVRQRQLENQYYEKLANR